MEELAKKVLIGIPTARGCQQATEVWLMVQAQKSYRIIYGLGPLSVEDSRTKVVCKFLEQKDFTHLLFVDSDVVPPFNVIKDLHAHDLDVVSANYPLYMEKQISSAGFALNEDKKTYKIYSLHEEGVKEVDAIGLGCCLIKREVIEKAVEYPCFQMRYGMKNGRFHMLDSDDVTFSKVVRKCGYKIHYDFDQICDHYKTTSLLGIVEDYERGALLDGERFVTKV